MEVLGYGEDGLTYFFLTRHLEKILGPLGDPVAGVDPEPLLFYRPSLGRSGGPKSPQLGEFDAIVATSKAVYFIESKWTNSVGPIHTAIILKKNQIDRHRVFGAVRAAWQRERPETWAAFCRSHATGFLARPLAREDRLLACNMFYLLRRLEPYPDRIRDLLVFFHRSDDPNLIAVTSISGEVLPEFEIVPVRYTSLENSGFFNLSPGRGDGPTAPTVEEP
jgi:hypothetical protein